LRFKRCFTASLNRESSLEFGQYRDVNPDAALETMRVILVTIGHDLARDQLELSLTS
jgi:hypothetical protein